MRAALVAAAALAGFAFAACGGGGAEAPLSQTASTAGEAVVGTTEVSPSSPVLPAVGSSIVLESLEAVTPVDSLLEMTSTVSGSTESEYWLLDPHSHKGYRETASPCPTPGYSVMIFDATGHRTMDGVTLEVYPEPAGAGQSADYSQIVHDMLEGMTATVTGLEDVDGRETVVVETEVAIPEGPSIAIVANLDPATGLRVREIWTAVTQAAPAEAGDWSGPDSSDPDSSGGDSPSAAPWSAETQTVTIRRTLVAPTPELLAKLDPRSIEDVAAGFRGERSEKLGSLPYLVYGLPDSMTDYGLLWVIPGRDWTSVRLEYESLSASGRPSVTVISTDLEVERESAKLFTASRDEAVAQAGEGSDVIRFRDGNVGVQVQADRDSISRLTAALVRVGGSAGR